MAGAGELVPRPALRGEVLPPAAPAPSGSGGGSVYADFVGRLRDYVAPPPPGELGWQACIGVGLMLGSAGLLALLPSGEGVASGGFFRWVSSSGVASTIDSVKVFVEPLAIFAMVMLLGVAAVYLWGRGTTPVLTFLSAQTWLGVLSRIVPLVVWIYLIGVVVVNLVVWFFYIVMFIVLAIIALMILGLFASS
jgi:hypothetical protein